MSIAVLYRDGVGKSNVAICDRCNRVLEDEEYPDSVTLHKLPLTPLSGEYVAQVWIVHAECIRGWIHLHDFPRGKWYLARSGELGKAFAMWEEIDMERFYDPEDTKKLEKFAQGRGMPPMPPNQQQPGQPDQQQEQQQSPFIGRPSGGQQ